MLHMKYSAYLMWVLLGVALHAGDVSCAARAVDLYYSEITTVTDDSRYTTKYPDVELLPFTKLKNVKGNYAFTAGQRITGDRLILTHMDRTQFTKTEDVETLLRYPKEDTMGATLTRIEIYVELSSDNADAYFTEGGINQTNAEILLTCDQTRTFVYEIFIYGY